MKTALDAFKPFKTPGPDGIYPVLPTADLFPAFQCYLLKGWKQIEKIYQVLFQLVLSTLVQLCTKVVKGRNWYLRKAILRLNLSG